MTNLHCKIIGGGPVGMISALMLAQHNIAVTIFDPKHSKDEDGRLLALSYLSIQLLQDLGIEQQIFESVIKKVQISHNGFGISYINHSDIDLPYLGYTIKYATLYTKLLQLIEREPNITWEKCTVTDVINGIKKTTIKYLNSQQKSCTVYADMVIIADGGNIKLDDINYTEYNYQQIALSVKLQTQCQAIETAYERLDNNNALVLLLHHNYFTMVWALPNTMAKQLLVPQNLTNYYSSIPFFHQFGKIDIVDKIYSFPLKLKVADTKTINNTILIGNVAQTVHPISAQGMNLAIRDILVLSNIIQTYGITNKSIAQFTNLRIKDGQLISKFTHGIAYLIDKHYSITNLRGLGLLALNQSPLVKNYIARSLIFGKI
jgi:2-octaprenyl-6-methoxyphenol hydroxylase